MTRSPCRRGANGILTQHACSVRSASPFGQRAAPWPTPTSISSSFPSPRTMRPPRRRRYDGPLGDDLRSALERGEFRAKANEIYVAAHARVRLARGARRLRRRRPAQRDQRRAHSAHGGERRAGRRASSGGRASAGPISSPASSATAARIETVAEGFVLANFDNGVHKSRDERPVLHPRRRHLHVRQRRRPRSRPAAAMGESINAARVLINEPGNYLTPRVLADKAAALASVPGITRGDSRRAQDRRARHGPAARRRARQHRAAAHPGPQVFTRPAPRRSRRSASSAKASRSIPAASR